MFKVTKNESQFGRLYVVTGCIAKESARYAINNLYIENNQIIATDGKRLAVAELNSVLEPGFYELVKRTKSEIVINKTECAGRFPKWQDVIPDYTTEPGHKIELTTPDKFTQTEAKAYFRDTFCFAVARYAGFGVNADYVADCWHSDINYTLHLQQFSADRCKPFLLTGDNIKVVIMPRFYDKLEVENIGPQPQEQHKPQPANTAA